MGLIYLKYHEQAYAPSDKTLNLVYDKMTDTRPPNNGDQRRNPTRDPRLSDQSNPITAKIKNKAMRLNAAIPGTSEAAASPAATTFMTMSTSRQQSRTFSGNGAKRPMLPEDLASATHSAPRPLSL
eukprot:jgi/Psemu1/32698/gm1.32698_g